MLGRILRSADFERVLGMPACARSPHFAVHFLDGRPAITARRTRPAASELSTDRSPVFVQPVDDLPALSPPPAWLGMVVPKRHAKRAVTRTLLKRQIRAALQRRDDSVTEPAALRPGLWVVRLRAPFDRAAFPSAASDALRNTARGELDALLGQAMRKLGAAEPAVGAG